MNQATRQDTIVPQERESRAEYRAPALEVIELIDAIGERKVRGSGFTPDMVS